MVDGGQSQSSVLGDLKSPYWICFKGWLFLATGMVAVAVLLLRRFHWQDVVLLLIANWSFCRFYYFAFYVIQHYVDPGFRYAGLWDFVWRQRWRSQQFHNQTDDAQPDDRPGD